VSKFPALTAELLRRGYTELEVKKVLGLNLLRVMRAAEAAARQLAPSRRRLARRGGRSDGRAAPARVALAQSALLRWSHA